MQTSPRHRRTTWVRILRVDDGEWMVVKILIRRPLCRCVARRRRDDPLPRPPSRTCQTRTALSCGLAAMRRPHLSLLRSLLCFCMTTWGSRRCVFGARAILPPPCARIAVDAATPVGVGDDVGLPDRPASWLRCRAKRPPISTPYRAPASSPPAPKCARMAAVGHTDRHVLHAEWNSALYSSEPLESLPRVDERDVSCGVVTMTAPYGDLLR